VLSTCVKPQFPFARTGGADCPQCAIVMIPRLAALLSHALAADRVVLMHADPSSLDHPSPCTRRAGYTCPALSHAPGAEGLGMLAVWPQAHGCGMMTASGLSRLSLSSWRWPSHNSGSRRRSRP
jgi:hypothetical protein